jgi:hypothetical protein
MPQPDLEESFFVIQNKQWKTAPGELQQTSGCIPSRGYQVLLGIL